jgi:hypothetical protein
LGADHDEEMHLVARLNGGVPLRGHAREEERQVAEDVEREEAAEGEEAEGARDEDDDLGDAHVAVGEGLHHDERAQREDVVNEGGGEGRLAGERVEHLRLVEQLDRDVDRGRRKRTASREARWEELAVEEHTDEAHAAEQR